MKLPNKKNETCDLLASESFPIPSYHPAEGFFGVLDSLGENHLCSLAQNAGLVQRSVTERKERYL